MIKLTVLYPNTPDSHFDLRYYLDKHVPMVKEQLTPVGLQSVELQEGLVGAAPDAPPTYTMIGSMNFATLEDLQNALANHMADVIADVANFTNVQPVVQIGKDS